MNSLTLHLIIILVSILSFFSIVFGFLFWHFKFRSHRGDSLTAPPSTVRSRSQDPKFQARLEHYNNSQSTKQSSASGRGAVDQAREDEDVEAEFGRVRGNVQVQEEGVISSLGKREANGTRSFLNGWFGLDPGTGAGYNNHTVTNARPSPPMVQVNPNLSRSFSLQSRPVQPPSFLGGAMPQERDLERQEEVEMEAHDPEERRGLRAADEMGDVGKHGGRGGNNNREDDDWEIAEVERE